MTKEKPQELMTVKEAGRKGGRSTLKKYGPAFYEAIGKKGGETVSSRYGRDHFERIGRKGGQRVRELIELGKKAAAETPPE